jgi:hypothetical protein
MMWDNKKSRRRRPGGGKQTSNQIVAHPAQFFKDLPEKQRREAIEEYKMVIRSNALSPLAAWFRQTKNEAIKEELDQYFHEAERNEVLPF